ncbi:MAG: glycosyltransferase family 2 protein [Agriterribacter sp.]
MLLSIIIVNYNVKYFLEHCLHSVCKAARNMEVEIIVVDNHSTDDSRQYLEPKFTQVRFYWSNENMGFSKACNKGVEMSAGAFVLFLNPDTIVPEDCFEKCITFFETHADAGAIGVRMIDGSGNFLKESKRGYPSALVSFFKIIGFSRLFPQSPLFARYYLGNFNEHTTNKVDVLSGAFMMMRKEVVAITHGFDESFFMYGEDIDLSYAIQKAGYVNYYYPDVSVIHFKGESTQKQDLRYTKLFYGAMIIFVRKHNGKGKALLYSFFVQTAIFFRAGIAAIIQLVRNIILWLRKCFYNLFKPAIKKNNKEKLMVVGSVEEYELILQIIGSGGSKKKMIHLAVQANESTENLALSINQTIELQHINRIVFCEGALSFQKVIQLLEGISKNVVKMICASGSQSIITSPSKKLRGDTFTY